MLCTVQPIDATYHMRMTGTIFFFFLLSIYDAHAVITSSGLLKQALDFFFGDIRSSSSRCIGENRKNIRFFLHFL